jgi:hypothetical protein
VPDGKERKVSGAAVLRKIRALHGGLEAPGRQALAGEIDK